MSGVPHDLQGDVYGRRPAHVERVADHVRTSELGRAGEAQVFFF